MFNGVGLTVLVRPALDILDRLYSSQMVLEKLARQHGDLPNKWPPAVAQQLRQRHNALARSIEKHVCSLSDDCYPIGTQRFPDCSPCDTPPICCSVASALLRNQAWQMFHSCRPVKQKIQNTP